MMVTKAVYGASVGFGLLVLLWGGPRGWWLTEADKAPAQRSASVRAGSTGRPHFIYVGYGGK